jgi:hypothetical protein
LLVERLGIEFARVAGPHSSACFSITLPTATAERSSSRKATPSSASPEISVADRWAAYDRNLKLLGEEFGSRGQAAACLHDCTGRPKILMRDIAMVQAQG